MKLDSLTTFGKFAKAQIERFNKLMQSNPETFQAAGFRQWRQIVSQNEYDPEPITILSADLVKHSRRERKCCWGNCGKTISQGHAYKRIVYKDENNKFVCDSVCLDCWIGHSPSEP